MEKITEKQIKFIELLREAVGYTDEFQGNLKDMPKDKASQMIEKLIYTRNHQLKKAN